MSETLEIAMSFIVETDKYFFEQRKKGRANGALGKIGCWGGQLQIKEGTEKMETPLEAVYREITREEITGLEGIPESRFRQRTYQENPIEVISDRDGQPIDIRAHLFELKPQYGEGQQLSAPNSVWLDIRQLQAVLNNNQLTPATEAAVVEYLDLVKKESKDGA